MIISQQSSELLTKWQDLRKEITAEHEKVRQHQVETMRAELAKEVKEAATSTLSESKFETAVTDILSSKDYLEKTLGPFEKKVRKELGGKQERFIDPIISSSDSHTIVTGEEGAER